LTGRKIVDTKIRQFEAVLCSRAFEYLRFGPLPLPDNIIGYYEKVSYKLRYVVHPFGEEVYNG